MHYDQGISPTNQYLHQGLFGGMSPSPLTGPFSRQFCPPSPPPPPPPREALRTTCSRWSTIKLLLRISLICAFRIFSRFRTAFDGRRSTQAWLQNFAPFQVFINTSVIQDKTLTIYINFGKFKLEKAPNFVTRPASNVERRSEARKNSECTYQ